MGEEKSVRYRVPNVNQCKECHDADDQISPIGPKARNINKELDLKDMMLKIANEGITSILIESGPKLIESFGAFKKLSIFCYPLMCKLWDFSVHLRSDNDVWNTPSGEIPTESKNRKYFPLTAGLNGLTVHCLILPGGTTSV